MTARWNPVLGILVAAVISLAGCASRSAATVVEETPAATEKLTAAELEKKFQEFARGYNRVERDGKSLYCKNEKVIGSTVPRLQCYSEAQLRNMAESMDVLRQQMRNNGRCTLGRGCRGS